MTGQYSNGNGDLNLSAALVTMGIPPDPVEPIKLIARDNGKDYVRFCFLNKSICGKYDSSELNDAWTNHVRFTEEKPNHPFSILMRFIAERPKGCTCQDDWLSHASSFLGLTMDSTRKLYSGIATACKSSPESPASYVIAFVRNRVDLTATAKRMASRGNFKNMSDRSKTISIIPAKAPKRIKDFLLSHIR